mmetsp:Transcript_78693/g.131947  ORF Transcript_78693/g.131947 Transcript_78693/m.131947 type:complete len:352 (+) Transcript_78693:552-1607(+)
MAALTSSMHCSRKVLASFCRAFCASEACLLVRSCFSIVSLASLSSSTSVFNSSIKSYCRLTVSLSSTTRLDWSTALTVFWDSTEASSFLTLAVNCLILACCVCDLRISSSVVLFWRSNDRFTLAFSVASCWLAARSCLLSRAYISSSSVSFSFSLMVWCILLWSCSSVKRNSSSRVRFSRRSISDLSLSRWAVYSCVCASSSDLWASLMLTMLARSSSISRSMPIFCDLKSLSSFSCASKFSISSCSATSTCSLSAFSRSISAFSSSCSCSRPLFTALMVSLWALISLSRALTSRRLCSYISVCSFFCISRTSSRDIFCCCSRSRSVSNRFIFSWALLSAIFSSSLSNSGV